MTDRLVHVGALPFEAARQVKILPENHRSRRLHGHSFLVRLRAFLPEKWVAFPGGETGQLVERLQQCIEPLDYNHLNEIIEVPTDENIARWVRQRIDVPGIETLGLQSTRNEGADLDDNNHAHIWCRFRFEAAHQLPNVADGHQCGRMHGHGFEIILHADQDLGSRDMGVDFDYLEECWRPLHQQLHYACLNDIPGLENPTSEHLAGWIWAKVKPGLPQLSWVTVYETAMAGCHYDGEHYRIWKEQRFESALRLNQAPEGDVRRQLHGHSYVLRLHLSAPLDDVMGWTVDYGDVKELFKPVYKRLDHRLVNDQVGIHDGHVGAILTWMKEQSSELIPQLDRIDLYETPGCGAILAWGDRVPALPG